MVLYDPIFGIRFLPEILTTVGRIHISRKKHQLPFAGVTNLELMDNTIMIASIKFRQRMGAIHYLTLTGNYGLTDSNFFDILKGKQLFGVSGRRQNKKIKNTIINGALCAL